jgi:hypothetical protein
MQRYGSGISGAGRALSLGPCCRVFVPLPRIVRGTQAGLTVTESVCRAAADNEVIPERVPARRRDNRDIGSSGSRDRVGYELRRNGAHHVQPRADEQATTGSRELVPRLFPVRSRPPHTGRRNVHRVGEFRDLVHGSDRSSGTDTGRRENHLALRPHHVLPGNRDQGDGGVDDRGHRPGASSPAACSRITRSFSKRRFRTSISLRAANRAVFVNVAARWC